MILRGLTLWRPWAAAIVHGPKRIENRPWAPPKSWLEHGLWIAIHAGRTWDAEGAAFILEQWPEAARRVCELDVDARPRSHDGRGPLAAHWPPEWKAEGIVGVARVVRAWEFDSLSDDGLPGMEWAFGPWCWDLADVRALPAPIPCRGAQGLWKLPPPVYAQLQQLIPTRSV